MNDDPDSAIQRATQMIPFIWFDNTEGTLSELARQIQAGGPGVRLEIHTRHDGTWLHVIPGLEVVATAAPGSFAPLNKSHICPPICP